MKKGRESCRVDGSSGGGGGGLADVLITEFLISNISQKRGEGNESGGEERALPNGCAEGIPSREPPGQRQCQSQILSDFHFSVDRGRKAKERIGFTQLHAEDSIFFRRKTEFIDLPPSAVVCYAASSSSSAFGRISLMRDDDGGDNRDEERKRGRRKMRGRSNER